MMDLEAEHAAYLTQVHRFIGKAWRGDRGITLPAARYLLAFLERERPASILELGTGFSTLVLREGAADVGCRVVSADHDPQWLSFMRGILSGRERISHEDYFTIRGIKDVAKRRRSRFDCVFVDHGPTGAARRADLPWCSSIIKKGGVLILDDWYPPGTPIHRSFTTKAATSLRKLGFRLTVEEASGRGVRKSLCVAKRR